MLYHVSSCPNCRSLSYLSRNVLIINIVTYCEFCSWINVKEPLWQRSECSQIFTTVRNGCCQAAQLRTKISINILSASVLWAVSSLYLLISGTKLHFMAECSGTPALNICNLTPDIEDGCLVRGVITGRMKMTSWGTSPKHRKHGLGQGSSHLCCAWRFNMFVQRNEL
jgi:hypothetical protein